MGFFPYGQQLCLVVIGCSGCSGEISFPASLQLYFRKVYILKFKNMFDWYGTGGVVISALIISYAFWDFMLSTIILWVFIVLVLWIHH